MTDMRPALADEAIPTVTDLPWLAVYRGYDGEALAMAAGPGPARKARKEVDAGLVSWREGSASDGIVMVSDQAVSIDGSGLAGARCACSATGLCRHILAACLWLHEQAGSPATTTTAPTAEDDPATTAALVTEILALDPARLLRAAGVAAQRAAAGATAADLSCSVTAMPGRLSITWTGLTGPVLYVAGAGLVGMISEVPEPHRRAIHLEALARVRATHGTPWVWPEAVRPAQNRTRLTADQERVADACQDVVRLVVSSGLSHLAPGLVDRLTSAAFSARAADLPLLARLLSGAAADVQALVDRSDDMSESRCAATLADVWVLVDALRDPDPDAFAMLHGVARRSYVDDEVLDAVPLGVTWWTTSARARGLTVTFWDRELRALTRVTTGRAAGADPGFQRGIDTSLIWGASVERIVEGPFRLTAPRTSTDGSLSASATSGFDRSAGEPFSHNELRGLALNRWAQITSSPALAPRLGTPPSGALLLAPTSVEPVRIDEVHQHLVWTVHDADGERLDLRQAVTSTSATRNKALLTLPADRRPIAILVETTVSDGVLLLEPTNLFVEINGALRLVPLDFPELFRTRRDWWAHRAAAQQADALLKKGHESHVAHLPSTRRSLAERVCRPALDILDACCATGRPLSPRQREALARQQALARDLALDSVADALGGLVTRPETRATSGDEVGPILHAVLVLGRALQIGASRTF